MGNRSKTPSSLIRVVARGVAIATLFAASLPSYLPATTVATDVLKTLGWTKVSNVQDSDFDAVTSGACNYMYIDGSGTSNATLYYYGTSKNCQKRLSSHKGAITSAYDLIAAYREEMQANGIDSSTIEARIEDRASHPPIPSSSPGTNSNSNRVPSSQGTGTRTRVTNGSAANRPQFSSDTCIGVKSVRNVINIYTLEFPDEVSANAAETCVLGLGGIQGDCNRKGAGKLFAEPETVAAVLRKCRAFKDVAMKTK